MSDIEISSDEEMIGSKRGKMMVKGEKKVMEVEDAEALDELINLLSMDYESSDEENERRRGGKSRRKNKRNKRKTKKRNSNTKRSKKMK